MKNILITTSSFDTDGSGLRQSIKSRGLNPVDNPHKRKLSESEIKKLIEDFQPLAILAGTEPLNKNVLDASKALKVISRIGVGCENIDFSAAKAKGIEVRKTSEGLTASVAELTVALMLDVLRKISLHDRDIRRGQWNKHMGLLLAGKNVGVIGFGQIGRYVAHIMKSFNASVNVYDPYIDPKSDLSAGVRYFSSLSEFLQACDILTIHASVKEGECILGKKEFSCLKPDAVVINTSRGNAVDEDALYDALDQRKIYGAGIDVFSNEPYQGRLKELDNVVLTAHIGSYAKEARQKMEKSAVAHMFEVLERTGAL